MLILSLLGWQVDLQHGSNCAINVEESRSSFKCRSPPRTSKTGRGSRSLSNEIVAEPEFASSSKCDTNVSGKLMQHEVFHPISHNYEHCVSSTEIRLGIKTYLRFMLLLLH